MSTTDSSHRTDTTGARPARWAAWPIATALRRAFAKGYGRAELRADVLAGMVVGVVALPLSMALAIAVGAPPQHGLYTAMIAGAAVALFGGCKFQVTGPTAAFVMILNLAKVPVIDSSGLVALDNAIGSLIRRRHAVVLAGPLPRPRRIFDKAKLTRKHAGLHIVDSLDAAISRAQELVADREHHSGRGSSPPQSSTQGSGARGAARGRARAISPIGRARRGSLPRLAQPAPWRRVHALMRSSSSGNFSR